MLTIMPTVKLARPDCSIRASCWRAAAALPEGDGDDAELVAALRTHGLHARWLPWDDPGTLDADLVILRATWDYIDRLDEFLAWTTSVRNLINAPAVVAWNTDKRYLADLAAAGVPTVPSRFFAPGERVRLPKGELVVKPAIGAGSVGAQRFTDADAARRHVAALQAEGRTVLVQPYDERVEDGETALVFLGGRQSHAFTKGPILPPPGDAPEFDDSGTYAEESLTPAEPDFELWDVGHAALDAAAAHLGIDVTRVAVRAGGRDRRPVGSATAGTRARRAVAGLASARRRHAGAAAARLRRRRREQPSSGSASVRCRIDAHSAAVAAVQAAAPATWMATSAAGTPVRTAHGRRVPARRPPRAIPRGARTTGRGAATARSANTRPTSSDKYATSSVACTVHQGDDLHLQPRHRILDALVAGVRARAGDQRAGDEHRGQHGGAQKVNWRNGFGTWRTAAPLSGSPILT